jgi:hypothetical protein
LKDSPKVSVPINGRSAAQEITVKSEDEHASRVKADGTGEIQPLGRLVITATLVGEPPADALVIPLLTGSSDGMGLNRAKEGRPR